VSKIFAGHHPKNVASHRLIEQLGFQYTHHEYYPPTGLQHPSYILIKEQYRPKTILEPNTKKLES
jgi:RimJ/RimL family protein N-acetyltransferase